MTDDAEKLRASIERVAAKFSTIQREKHHTQLIDFPGKTGRPKPVAKKNGKKAGGRIVKTEIVIDEDIQFVQTTFVPWAKPRTNLEKLIKKAQKCKHL
jgi:hypothetical protein